MNRSGGLHLEALQHDPQPLGLPDDEAISVQEQDRTAVAGRQPALGFWRMTGAAADFQWVRCSRANPRLSAARARPRCTRSWLIK